MDNLTPLHHLRAGQPARVAAIEAPNATMAEDLADIGFLVGVEVEVLERGPVGRTPLAVRLGRSIIAVRSSEAAAIKVLAL